MRLAVLVRDGVQRPGMESLETIWRDPETRIVAQAADAAHATGDALTATARVVEGRQGGPLTDAARAYERAGRELWGRTPPRTFTGDGIRAAARVLTLTGRARRDESAQFLHLVTQLIALSEAVAGLRDVQGRAAQAAAAREAANKLRTVAPMRHGGHVVRPWRQPTPGACSVKIPLS